MKIHDVKIVLDKDYFYSGTKVTGKLLVKTGDYNWAKTGKVFLKFYDRLDIEWVEDEVVTVGVVKRNYSNFQKPFQLNFEAFLTENDAVVTNDETHRDTDVRCVYQFGFDVPNRLQGTLNVKNAKCQYFIKAYLTSDESIAKHYQQGANVFDEFFKSLTHTYCKQEVIILNPLAVLPAVAEKHSFEAKSSHIRVVVTLPKLFFSRKETIQVHCQIDRIDNTNGNSKHSLELHKVSFKLLQLIKVLAAQPYEKSRLFDTLIAHASRKNVHQNQENGILVEEYIQVPEDLPSSSTRTTNTTDGQKPTLNPIRVNYKLSLEFWKNFLVNELDVNIPLMIDPEA